MSSFLDDFRYGIRLALKSPWFAAAVIAILGLGVGSATGIFSIVNSVLLRPLPLPESGRIVRIYERSDAGQPIAVSLPNFRDWSSQATVFDAMAATAGRPTTLVSGERTQRAYANTFYGDPLGVLGVTVRYGRPFDAKEVASGALVAVTSHAFAMSFWGAPAAAVGQSLEWVGGGVTVIGVLEPAVDEGVDIFVPAATLGPDDSARTAHNWAVLARLQSGVSVHEAQLEMDQISARLVDAYGEDATTKGVVIRSLLEDTVVGIQPALALIAAAVGLLILVGCLNIASLLFARGFARQREIAVRLSLGASRARVLRSMLIESLPLALAGGLVGVVLAQLSFSTLLAMTPHSIPRRGEIALDASALSFGILLAVGSGVLFALLPAVKTSALGTAEALKSGQRAGDGSSSWVRRSLVIGQLALALALLTCSGLLVRSLLRMTNVEAGFDHTHALLAEFELPMSRYPTDAALLSYWDAASSRLQALPGVEAVGISRAAPLESFIPAGVIFLDDEEREAYASYGLASAGYFSALDIPLLRGRLFDAGDSVDSPHVAVINQAAAEAFWPGVDPLGRTVRWAGMDIYSDAPLRIVGIVGNAREQSLTTDPAPTVYSNFFQRPARARDADVLIRATQPGGLVAAVRREFEAIDPSMRVRFQTLSESHSEALAKPRFGASLVTFFAACATLLSSLGLFSSMAYAVSRRTRELGVRMALGAAPRDVQRQILREALFIAAAGGGIGCVIAGAASRILETQLFGVSATDPATFGVASGLMMLTALVAGWAPAHAASRIDPIDALRQD